MPSPKKDDLMKHALGGIIWKFSERVLAQLVSLVVSVVLARILMPEDYSLVSIVAIFFAFCNVLVAGGFNAALIHKKDADSQDYSSVLYLTLAVAAVLYGLMFFLAPWLAQLYEQPLLVAVTRVMALTFFINAFKSVLSAYTSSNLQFKKFFFSTIIGTVVSAVVGIYMAAKGFGVWALVAQNMVNSFLDTVILWITTRLKLVCRFSWKRLKGLLGYGWKVFVASVIGVAYEQINPLIVGLRFTTTDLAFYSKGQSFPSLINSTVRDTMSAVLFPVMNKVQDSKEAVLELTRRYVKLASFVVFPMMIGFGTVAESFITVVLTEKWLAAAPYIQIFALSYMFDLIFVGNLQAIQSIGRTDVTLIMEIIKKSCYAAVIFLFVMLSDSPVVLAMSTVVCTLVALVVNTYPNRKLIGYKYRYQLQDMLPNLILAAIMGAIVLLVGQLPLAAGWLLPLQVVCGVLVYGTMCLITKNESLLYLWKLLKRSENNDQESSQGDPQ